MSGGEADAEQERRSSHSHTPIWLATACHLTVTRTTWALLNVPVTVLCA